ncbi:hypothetical protein R1sor_016420 [Riccia sorocarpa]|uniref:Uncharacterized protein n=1 Tax=Riccia sorocarpa TaxID=122646 RepID=A0ABD3HGZ2_9MARC
MLRALVFSEAQLSYSRVTADIAIIEALRKTCSRSVSSRDWHTSRFPSQNALFNFRNTPSTTCKGVIIYLARTATGVSGVWSTDLTMKRKRQSALSDMLADVEGLVREGSFQEFLSNLADGPYGRYFQFKCEECRTRREVRLKTLEALGKSKNLEHFDNNNFVSWGLSAAEWEALLVPMQTHAQLKLIRITAMCSAYRQETTAAKAEAETAPLYRSLVAHAQNLISLNVAYIRPELAAQLALGLQENSNRNSGRCKLRTLKAELWGCVAETAAKGYHWKRKADNAKTALHLAEMVMHAPELEDITLLYSPPLDEETKHAWSKALKGCAYLKRIFIWSEAQFIGQDGFANVLIDAFTGRCPDWALQRLVICEVNLTVEELALLVTSSIQEIVVEHADPAFRSCSPTRWQFLGKAIHEAPKVRSFELRLTPSDWSNQGLKKLSAGLAELWKASEESQWFHVYLSVDFLHTFKRLGFPPEPSPPELQGEMDAFLDELLDFNFVRKISILNFSETVDFKSLIEKLAISTSLEEVTLGDDSHAGHEQSRDREKDACKYLFQCLKQNKSIKVLNLTLALWLGDDNCKDLMDLLEVNFTLEEISFPDSFRGYEENSDLINGRLRRNKEIADHFATLYGAKKLTNT